MKIELLSLDEIDPCQLAIHANDPLVNRYLKNSFPFPYTLDHAMRFITHSLEHNALDFGIVVDGICIGCVGATFHKDVFIKNCKAVKRMLSLGVSFIIKRLLVSKI